MWIENKILEEDLERIVASEFIDWDGFRDSSVFITGGTGLIGQTVINALLYANKARNLGIRITALVRNREKAEMLFSAQLSESEALSFIDGSVEDLPSLPHFDYMIHGASPTQSRYFVTNPVETINEMFGTTSRLLEIARIGGSDKFVYISSIEVYGSPHTDEPIPESFGSNVDIMSPRSSYPEGKRIAENLCAAYVSEYGINASTIRPTLTFGAGIGEKESRVFAYFARCAINGEDIVLKTKGQTKRNYLYTADAVTAILKVLQDGRPGEAYNAANEETYCTIAEMAGFVVDEIAEGRISVRYDLGADTSMFAPEMHLNLSAAKLHALGWHPEIGIDESLRRMIGHMEMERKSHAEG